jgi:hypothetical protein
MRHPKTIAAVAAAVSAYIQTEEEAFALQSAPAAAESPPAARFSPWQFSGRQEQMQMRLQMQLKAYHR